MTPVELADTVRRADAKVAAGMVRSRGGDLLVEVTGEVDSLDRLARIPLRASTDGRMVTVGDVASVRKALREPASSLALVGGRRAVVVAARMESGQRVDRWSARAREAVEAFAAELPARVRLHVVFDQSGYTDARLGA